MTKSKKGESKYDSTIEYLKEHPGKWARLTNLSPTGAGLALGEYPGIEATIRGDVLYARWVGEASE